MSRAKRKLLFIRERNKIRAGQYVYHVEKVPNVSDIELANELHYFAGCEAIAFCKSKWRLNFNIIDVKAGDFIQDFYSLRFKLQRTYEKPL